jgi:hypothetical protein
LSTLNMWSTKGSRSYKRIMSSRGPSQVNPNTLSFSHRSSALAWATKRQCCRSDPTQFLPSNPLTRSWCRIKSWKWSHLKKLGSCSKILQNLGNFKQITAHLDQIFALTPKSLAILLTVLTFYRSTRWCLLALGFSCSKISRRLTRTGILKSWPGLASTVASTQLIWTRCRVVSPTLCSNSSNRVALRSSALDYSSASMEVSATSCSLIDQSFSTICACTWEVKCGNALTLDAARSSVCAVACANTSKKCIWRSNLIFARNVKQDSVDNLILTCTRRIAMLEDSNLAWRMVEGYFRIILTAKNRLQAITFRELK